MTLLYRQADGSLTNAEGTGGLVNVHAPNPECYTYGCVIHSPSYSHMMDWQLLWRDDRGLMERLCPHGVGHPDLDSADWATRHGLGRAHNTHGCDGCCDPRGQGWWLK